jgi:hypothetical protein
VEVDELADEPHAPDASRTNRHAVGCRVQLSGVLINKQVEGARVRAPSE